MEGKYFLLLKTFL